MEDIGLVRQFWNWVLSKKVTYVVYGRCEAVCGGLRGGVERHWPRVCGECRGVWRGLGWGLGYWKGCVVRGCGDVAGFGPAALMVILWSCFLCLTDLSCLVYLLAGLGVAGATIQYLGCTPGLFIVGLFAILVLWMYANYWIMGALLLVGGYLFSLNHARLLVLIATVYSIYCVKVRVGWLGIFLSINLAFLSNDAWIYLLRCCDNLNERSQCDEEKASHSTPHAESEEHQYSNSTDKSEKFHSNKSSHEAASPKRIIINQAERSTEVVKEGNCSLLEMKRIISSADHYDALGIPRQKKIDGLLLKKEYRKKAMLVHPDKNMGSPLASESFKKLQCAYEVLSDLGKKRDYDELLRKNEFKQCVQKSPSSSNQWQDAREYNSEESRRIQCTKCGNSHVWVCTNRSKAKARWCQDCSVYHQAKDGDGWVEYKVSLVYGGPQKMEIPRAFVCAESKIFDVSEWAICQGMACRPNTHRPSFHVNMVGLERTTRSNSSRFCSGLDAEMMDVEEEEFELWLQQALASGLFCETPRRRKSWSPFKLHQKNDKKQWRRSSSGFT
ncbi:hypothetical protein Droror1_Dr00015150 [Drosera rotundifolia]